MGKYVINITAHTGVRMRIVATNPADPLRNVRLVPLEFAVTAISDAASALATDSNLLAAPFHPDFLSLLEVNHKHTPCIYTRPMLGKCVGCPDSTIL